MLLPLALLCLSQAPATPALPVPTPAAAVDPRADRAAAKAFRSLEPKFKVLRAASLKPGQRFAEAFDARTKEMETLKVSYFEIVDRHVARWSVAALVRAGELDWSLAKTLEGAPTPPDVTTMGDEAVATFRDLVRQGTSQLRDKARATWRSADAEAKESHVQSPELEAVRARLTP